MRISLPRHRWSQRRSRSGSAMVEMAVCFPVFMLILMGIIEFGRAMSVNQMLNSAARIGSRAAILDGSTNTLVTSKVKEHVVSTLGCSSSSVTVAIAATSSRTGLALTDVSKAKTGDLIEIDISVPFAHVSWSVKEWMGNSQIRGESAMQHE